MADKELQNTKNLMAALGRMPPKPHEEMKLRKNGPKKATRSKPKASTKR